MSSRKNGDAAIEKSPLPQTAKERGMMSPISNASSSQTAMESESIAMRPLSNAASECNMHTIPDNLSLGTSRSSIFNRKSSVSRAATAETASIRFSTSILVLLSMNVCLVIASRLTLWDSVVSRMLASLLAPFVAFFGYQWCHYYSIALTRKKRAFWVEPNILLTYQPRARYFGHLFKPDPPTPGVTDRDIAGLTPVDQLAALQSQEDETKNSEGGTEEELKEVAKRKAFLESRKQFYGGEWAAAMKGMENRTGIPSPQTESLFDQPSKEVKNKHSSAASTSAASTNIASSVPSQRLDEHKKDNEDNATSTK